jgi:hypothetical protein
VAENPGLRPPPEPQEFFAPLLKNQSDGRFFDFQSRNLLHRCGGEVPIEKVEACMRAGQVVIAPLESFSDACILLEAKFPYLFRNMAFGRERNRSPRKKIDASELVAELEKSNRRDRALYDLVSHLFFEELKNVFPCVNQLAARRQEFQSRCLQRRWKDRIRMMSEVALLQPWTRKITFSGNA